MFLLTFHQATKEMSRVERLILFRTLGNLRDDHVYLLVRHVPFIAKGAGFLLWRALYKN